LLLLIHVGFTAWKMYNHVMVPSAGWPAERGCDDSLEDNC
jgi:hypothetical protein